MSVFEIHDVGKARHFQRSGKRKNKAKQGRERRDEGEKKEERKDGRRKRRGEGRKGGVLVACAPCVGGRGWWEVGEDLEWRKP